MPEDGEERIVKRRALDFEIAWKDTVYVKQVYCKSCDKRQAGFWKNIEFVNNPEGED